VQGFVNLGADFGHAISILIPLICYLMGGGLLIASIYGFWQWLNPARSPRHPWMPFVALFTSAALLSYDRMLNFANNTFGGGVSTSLASNLTSYTAPTVDTAAMLGATPEDTLLNIIAAFEMFFQAYGALVVLFGLVGLHHVMQGNRQHGASKPIVQMVFGIAVMNVLSIATTVMGYFA